MRIPTTIKPTIAMRHCALLLLFLAAGASSMAQTKNISFEGTFDGAAGKKVELIAYSDPMSLHEETLDCTTADDNGHFTLAFYANYPRLVVLQIETYSQSFYAEPGRHYKMSLAPFDWNTDEKQNIYIAPVALPIYFQDLPDDELNLSIAAYDHVCDSVVVRHKEHLDLRFHPKKRYFDTLRRVLNGTHFANNTPFFQRYGMYRLAQAELDMGLASRKTLFKKYVDNQTLPYYDENYMQFFFALFDHSVSIGNKYVSINDLRLLLLSADPALLLDQMGHDPLLRNERVRELVTMQALHEMYHMPNTYPSDQVIKMLENYAKFTHFEEHRTMAENLLKVLNQQVDASSDLLSLSLPDEQGVRHPLDTFKGKWLYIAFVRLDDPTSVGELETMAHFEDTLRKATNDSINFLTIVCNREPQKIGQFLHDGHKREKYDWLFLHFDNNYKLLYNLGITAFPLFLTISPEGKIVGNTSPAPATGYLTSGPWWPKKEAESGRRLYQIEAEN